MNAPYSPPGAPPAYNPYAAPQVAGGFAFGPPMGLGPVAYRPHGGGLKWVYLASLLGGYALVGVGAAVAAGGEEDAGIAVLAFGAIMAVFVRLIVALVWIYGAWAAIPPDYRLTSTGRRVSPGEAIGYLFIPFFNLYWMFVVSGGLCDAVNSLLRSSGSYRTAPKGLSLAACICQFVPYGNALIAPFLWFFFMLSLDAASQAAASSGSSADSAAAQGFGGGLSGPPPAGGYGYASPPGGGYGGGYGPPGA